MKKILKENKISKLLTLRCAKLWFPHLLSFKIAGWLGRGFTSKKLGPSLNLLNKVKAKPINATKNDKILMVALIRI